MTTFGIPAPARPAAAARATVRAVRAWQLAPQPAGLPTGLSEPVAAAVVAPAGPAWAEHRTRFAIELVGDGTSGWHAPVGETVLQVIADDLAAGLIGHNAAAPRRLAYRKRAGRHRSGAHARQAASAVELACWDLASRASGSSVTDLLGGTVRRQVPVYASALGLDPAHEAAQEAAAWITSAGFWGQKWALTKQLIHAGPRTVAAVLGSLRRAAGKGRFMIDALGRCRVDEAMRLLPVLADLDITFAEELLPPGSWGWHRLRAADPVLFADAIPALTALWERGFALFALTNSLGSSIPATRPAAFQHLLDGVFYSAETGAIKPEREAFAAVEYASRLAPHQLLHVGDSLRADVAGAAAAGWHTAWLDRRPREGPLQPAARTLRIHTLTTLSLLLPAGPAVAPSMESEVR